MTTSKCINHDYRDAVSRCRQCHKPLCAECQLVTEEGIYCGKECYSEGKAFHERVAALKPEKRPGKLSVFFRRLLKLAIFVLAVALILYFLLDVDSIEDFLQLISKLTENFLQLISGLKERFLSR